MSGEQVLVKIGMDIAEYERGQRALMAKTSSAAKSIEDEWRNLGVKSSAKIDDMRRSIENSYSRIVSSSRSTAQDIIRAEEAKTAKLKALHEEQFGRQTTMLQSIKKNWLEVAAAASVAYGAFRAGKELIDASLRMERISISMQSVTDNATLAAREMQYLREESKRLGLVFADTSLEYIKFAAAAKNTTLEGEATRKIFTGLAEAGTALKLTQQDMSLIMMAATQMMSKGVVSMEELRRQMGERLPGAMKMAAEGMGLTTMQLIKQIESGKVLASDLLPALAEQLHKTYGQAAANAAQQGQASINRFNNALFETKSAVGNALMPAVSDMLTVFSGLGPVIQRVIMNTQLSFVEIYEFADKVVATVKMMGSALIGDDTASDTFRKRLDTIKEAAEEQKKFIISQYEQTTSSAKTNAELQAEAAINAARKRKEIEERGKDGPIDKAAKKAYEHQLKIVHDIYTAEEKMRADAEAGTKASLVTANKIVEEEYAHRLKIIADEYAAEEKIRLDAEAGTKRSLSTIDRIKLREPYALASYYSQLGYEEEVLNYKKQALAEELELISDRTKAEEIYYQTVKMWQQDLFESRMHSVSASFDDLESAFSDLSRLYADGSKEASRWQEAAKAMEVAQRGVAVVTAVATIANQGLGDPYTAFGRIAAMTAAMASLLASIGESVGGGGSAAGYSGGSTVTGAMDASTSVADSYELLKDTYSMEYDRLTAIYQQMRELNSNISGLVMSIVRGGTATGNYSSLAGVSYPGWWNMESGNWYRNAGIIGDILTWVEDLGMSIMGGKIESNVEQQGLDILGGSLRNVLTNGIGAQAYAQVKYEKEGGWFHSDDTWYDYYYSALDADTKRMLDLVYKNMSSSLLEIAENLGTDFGAVLDYSFESAKINLQGKSAEEINSALMEYFSKISDTAVENLFGDILMRYQKLNEGLLETATRVITDREAVMSMLYMTGQAFSGTTSAAIAFSESLISIAGSLEDLQDAFQTYYDAFFSDSEKHLMIQKQLTAGLGQYGFALPGSRGGYRGIVESLDLMTEAGQTAYVALLNMSKAADEYYDYMDRNIKESNYATRADYMRAKAGFDYGGIATGSESGYLATLHGTELIISPKSSYPATVNNGMNTEQIIAELRMLKESNERNGQSLAKIQNLLEYIEDWNQTGMPNTRAN